MFSSGTGSWSFSREADGVHEAPNLTGTPERNLLLGVLERAILDFVGNDEREAEDAEGWIFGELSNPSFEQFSFSWICQQLDLDYEKTAKMIRGFPKRGNSRIAPWYLERRYPTRRYLTTQEEIAKAG